MPVNSNAVSSVLGDQLSKHGVGLLLGALTLAGTFAIVVDRGNTGELRYNAVAVRMNEYERENRLTGERVLRSELALQQQAKDLGALVAQADARNDAQDVRHEDSTRQIRELQANDRELDRWRAGLTVSIVNMQEKLERVVVLLEQRLPDNGDRPPAGTQRRQ